MQPVELIKAAPRSTLDEADKNPAHGLDVDAFVAVEDENLSTKEAAEGFDRLSFSGSGGTVRTTSHSNSHGLSESQVALVCQLCVDL